MAVNDRHDIGPGAVNLAVNKALNIRAPILRVVYMAIQVAGQDVFGRHQRRGHAARNQKTLGVLVIAHADVTKTVDHALIKENAVGDSQLFNQCRIGCSQSHRNIPVRFEPDEAI